MDTTLDSIRTTSPASATATAPRRWPGRVLSGIPVAFLAFDAAIKLVNPAFVTEASVRIGLPPELAVGIGVVLAACLALYLIPRTAPLGAVLLTGYLGGAVLTHLRIGDPLISHTLFPIYVGALLWAGLTLRDDRVRRLVAAR
ncbi:MAG TPA: DoxX family protein [Kofleriaceae bacterium]|nr:DoxX family protein [Kofleriaceae bacterium]